MSRKCLWVFVNFHLWPQVTDNCKYVELGIRTPKRVMKLKSHTASHYARVQHLFSDGGRCSMNTEKNQLLVTDEPAEVQDLGKFTDISIYTRKSKDGNLERNIQRCGMQVIKRRNRPLPRPPSCLKSENQQEVSECVCELPPLPSSYRQLQLCRTEHWDSETRNEI